MQHSLRIGVVIPSKTEEGILTTVLNTQNTLMDTATKVFKGLQLLKWICANVLRQSRALS